MSPLPPLEFSNSFSSSSSFCPSDLIQQLQSLNLNKLIFNDSSLSNNDNQIDQLLKQYQPAQFSQTNQTSSNDSEFSKLNKRPSRLKKPSLPSAILERVAHGERYKTELCRQFEECGVCRYGTKCQYAHGEEELRSMNRHPKYKTDKCRTFHSTGFCPYGSRCHFLHDENDSDSKKHENKIDSFAKPVISCIQTEGWSQLSSPSAHHYELSSIISSNSLSSRSSSTCSIEDEARPCIPNIFSLQNSHPYPSIFSRCDFSYSN